MVFVHYELNIPQSGAILEQTQFILGLQAHQ